MSQDWVQSKGTVGCRSLPLSRLLSKLVLPKAHHSADRRASPQRQESLCI